MDQNLLGVIYSLLYISFLLVFTTLVSKKYKIDSEISRKTVHILGGNWIFIYHHFFDSLDFALVVPLMFIVINYFSAKYKIIKVIEREEEREGVYSLGTVYYSMATFCLILLDYMFKVEYISYMGMLIMAYGDGFAAILGLRFGKKYGIFKHKTLAGCMTLFFFSFLIANSVLYWHFYEFMWLQAFFIAGLGVVIEFHSDDGIDNITLPIGVGLYTYFILFSLRDTIAATIINGLVSYMAYRRKSLTRSGVYFAFFTGVILFALGEVPMYISLLLFFLLGSLISKVKNLRKSDAERLHRRGSHRNWVQVFCNSAPAVIVLVASHILHLPMKYAYLSGITCMCAACSDTFASELGMLSRKDPISIISWKPVKRGLSGGVTGFGMLAALLGSYVVASTIFLYQGFHFADFVWVGGFGFLSNVLDSILGAVLQVKYEDLDGSLTEKPESGGILLKPISGISFVNNDLVNLLSVSLITFSMYYLSHYLFV